MSNPGKQFENDWRDSMPNDAKYLRLKDPAQAFGQSDAMRFSLHNPYDCEVYRYPFLYCYELKSTQGSSLTYWRDDFDGKSGTFMIKKWQISGLLEAASHRGVAAGFVINFRGVARTYYLCIESFADYVKTLSKKSINEDDVVAAGGILIGQKQLKVHYRYDVEELMNVTAGGQGSRRAGAADHTSVSADNCAIGATDNSAGKARKGTRRTKRRGIIDEV